MQKHIYSLRDLIISVIDSFYPPFSRLMDIKTFRYAACGGTNSLFDILLYSFTYNYILQKSIIHFGSIAISPYIAAMMITFPITLLSGFALMRYIVFPDAVSTKKRVQGSKYVVVVVCCIFLNYIFLKLFIEKFGWWPLPSKIITTMIVVLFSYFSQRHFTFRVATIKN
ncbi:MAG TPA: GtrA family protein [Chitinophagaceae bacterium]|nr:GtrA family protein [Chitinophagaceae bacterium]